MPVIEELEDFKHPGYKHNLNEQVIYIFENGFGASVILGKYSYGLEMMLLTTENEYDESYVKSQILKLDSDLYYDVVGHLDNEKMKNLLKGIQKIKLFLEEEAE
ncbi:hypothetical protein HRH27_03500 [Enterococcus faecalis]|nr:hypothetical protein [Enterococcus faecalis]NSV26806.1 hypothetical protein [Enterococcus faecalis]